MPGDEEEEGADDLENEFNWRDRDADSQYVAESMLHAHMTYGRGGDIDGVPQPFMPIPNVPLLTNGQMVLAPANLMLCICLSVLPNAQLLPCDFACRLMTSHRSSTPWFLRSWAAGGRGSTRFLMLIQTFLVRFSVIAC